MSEIIYDFPFVRRNNIGIGTRLYILGTAIDGPVMEPTLVKTPEEAQAIFGNPLQGSLVRAFRQAYDINSNISIFLMRLSGKSATLEVAGFQDMEYDTLLSFRTLYGGAKYNATTYSVEYRDSTQERVLVLAMPDKRIVYNLGEHENIGHLVQHINDDARAGVHTLRVTSQRMFWSCDALSLGYNGPYHFEDGEDGSDLTRDDLYILLNEALDLLSGREVDFIALAGMYLDDVHPATMYGTSQYGEAVYSANDDYLQLIDTEDDNRVVSYHERLIDFCRNQMQLGIMSHGVIGIRPLKDLSQTIEYDNSYISRLVRTTALLDRYGLMRYQDGTWIDKGHFISIVASEVEFQKDTDEAYYDNGAVAYASFMTSRIGSTTNEQIPIEGLRYELSDETLTELAQLGVVTFRNSVRKGLVVTSGVTAAHWDNDLHDLANVRMIQITMAHMNDVVQKIYEADIDPAVRRVYTEDRIKQRLDLLKMDGVITGYDYEVIYDSHNEYGLINLKLLTKYTVDGIGTSASISPTGVSSDV